MSLTLITVSPFELEYYKVIYFVASSLTKVVTNLNFLSSNNKPNRFFPIVDSVSVSCVQNSKYEHYKSFYKFYKHEIVSIFLHYFRPKVFHILSFHYIKDYYNFCQH